jgi:phytoene dehydrogenase-like protein
VILATEGPESRRLLDEGVEVPAFRGTTTLHYAASRPPLEEPILVLDADRTGPVNNLMVMSAAAPSYAPANMHLISASVIGVPAGSDEQLDADARRQLRAWFGGDVDAWRLLRADRIPHALPDQTAGALDPAQRPTRLRPGLYVCGDHRDNASIDGAMTSGFRAAQAVMEDLHRGLT